MFTVTDIMGLPYFVDKKGHAIVTFPKGCEPRLARRARLVFCANGGVLNDGEIVHHADANKLNDSVDNLTKLKVGEHTHLHCAGIHRGGSFAKGNTYGSVNAGRTVTWADKIAASKRGKKLSASHRAAIAAAMKSLCAAQRQVGG